jgi:hypothetical protein|eukprot:2141993-Prymnesium_polylepis.2
MTNKDLDIICESIAQRGREIDSAAETDERRMVVLVPKEEKPVDEEPVDEKPVDEKTKHEPEDAALALAHAEHVA